MYHNDPVTWISSHILFICFFFNHQDKFHQFTRQQYRTYGTDIFITQMSASHGRGHGSRAWGTIGVLLALTLGLIARIPQSDIVLIAAIRCIGICCCSSTGAAGLLLLLRVLGVAVWLLLVLLRGWL